MNGSTHMGKPARKNAIRKLLKAEGRSWAWLSRQSGYSDEHLRRVDAGGHPGTPKFWVAVRAVLGDRIDRKAA